MFGGSIQELFGSLSVGLIITFYSCYLFYYVGNSLKCDSCEKEDFLSYYKDKMSHLASTNTFLAFILLISIYAIGQLTEDVTDHLTDSTTPKIIQPKLAQSILGTEEEYRFNVLIKAEEVSSFCADTVKWELNFTSLGKYVFNHEAVVNTIIKMDTDITVPLKSFKDRISLPNNIFLNKEKDSLYAITSALYYRSKNWCYTNNDNHFRELELIQNRIDFSRSTALISTLFLVLFIAILVCQGVVFLITKMSIKRYESKLKPDADGSPSHKIALDKRKDNLNWLMKKTFRPIVFLTFLFFISKIGYRITEQNFNERAFGYYFGNIDEQKIKDDKILK